MKVIEREMRQVLEDFPEPFSARQLLEVINGRLRNGSHVATITHYLRLMGYIRLASAHSKNAGVWVKGEA